MNVILRTACPVLLSLLIVFTPLFPGNIQRANADASTFMLNKTRFGPNETVRIDLGILTYGCDYIYGVSDIYVVPRDSAVLGADLRGLDPSGTPNTVTASSGGGIVSEIIGFTAPSGTIDPGDWDVVEDVCQDGTFDSIDSVLSPGFTVEILTDVPPLPDSQIAAVKSEASAAKEDLEETYEVYSDLFAALDALDLYGALTSVSDAFLWSLQQSWRSSGFWMCKCTMPGSRPIRPTLISGN